MIGIPIRGTAKGTAEQAFVTAQKRGAQRLDFTRQYFIALYQDAAAQGVNADVAVAQWSTETGDGTSDYWTRDGNPAGLAAFPDGTNWGLTFTPHLAARAQITHLCRYLGMDLPVGWIATDARWGAVADAGYVGTVTTTADLGNGKWATDPRYAQTLYDRYVAYWGEPDETHGSEVPVSTPIEPTQKTFVLNAGHHNTTRGGARGEFAWTLPATKILGEELRKAGAVVYIVQENDGDNDPAMLNKPLQYVGRVVADLDKRYGPIDGFISMHYNGGGARGFHVIPPDAGGLKDATGGGVITSDSKASNGRDWRMARHIRDRLQATNTVPPIAWTEEKGVMSERETGVGADGWRLSELHEAMPVKDHAVRMIIEAGSIDTADAKYINDPDWVRNVYCKAIIDGIRDEIGELGTGDTTIPVPIEPLPQYVAGAAIADLDAAEKAISDANVQIPLVRTDAHTWVWVNDQVVATKPTGAYASPDLSDLRTRADIREGERFWVTWIGIPVKGDGPEIYRTPYKTIVRVADTQRVQDAQAA